MASSKIEYVSKKNGTMVQGVKFTPEPKSQIERDRIEYQIKTESGADWVFVTSVS